MTQRLPYFPFYPSDYLSGSTVAQMSLEEQGAFVRLLCYEWNDGPLPTDTDRLARLCGVSPEKMASLWPGLSRAFVERDEGYVNERLEIERRRIENKKAKLSRAGKKGARKRWQNKDENGVANGEANGDANGEAIAYTESESDTDTEEQYTHGGLDSVVVDPFEEAVERVFSYCAEARQDRTGGVRIKKTDSRLSKIRARMREAIDYMGSLEEAEQYLCRAADGFYADTWEERDQYLDMRKYLFKDDGKVDKWARQHLENEHGLGAADRALLQKRRRMESWDLAETT